VDAAGNLYIADTYHWRIRKVTAATGIITTIAGNGFVGFFGDNGQGTAASIGYVRAITVDSGSNVTIVDTNKQRFHQNCWNGIITTIAGNGQRGFSGDGGLATAAALADPSGVAIDAAGNLFIADTFNFRVRKVAAKTGVITTIAGNGSLSIIPPDGLGSSA